MTKTKLTRRSVMQTGAVAGAGLALPTILTAGSHSGFANAPTGSSVTLGFNVPQSGPYADEGADELRAYKLAVEHLNGEGDGGMLQTFSSKALDGTGILGKKVEYVTGDTQTKPDAARASARSMIEKDGAIMITGGSSSGSGSAVAARMAFGSLGSDTGGSIRLPAGFCGLVGIKPTQTRVSRYGVMGLSFSLDNVGPLTRTVKDNALILSVIAGHDPKDATSSTQPVGNYLEAVDNPSAKGCKIGIARGYFEDGADNTIIESRNAAVKSFTEQGASIVEIDCGDINHINSLAAFIAGTEAATLHAYWLRHRRDDYGPQVLARIESGLQFSGVDYLHAIQLRPKIITEFVKKAFADCDIILAPTFNIETPRIDETDVEDGQGFEALMSTVSHCTRPFNYLTLPSLSLPTPELANEMPASIQLIAPPFHEKLLYRVGSAYEKHTSFSQRAPNL